MHQDALFMRRAIELAEGGLGIVFPNPLVGAVVVSGGEIVGEGFHRGPGTPHAECVAMARAGERARGATLYLNLEPCCHYGRTPPCTDAILKAGIGRVVFGVYDPDPRVGGKGAAVLRDAGVEVESGVCAGEALELNLPYVHRSISKKSFIVLKLASTLDGRLTVRGRSWLTGRSAREYDHYLRSWTEAIAVGIGTIRIDDPTLDRRFFRTELPPPVRVIFDTSLRFPAEHPWLASEERTIIYCREDAEAERRTRLENAGAEVVPLPAGADGLDLEAWLDDVGGRHIGSVLVEGGGRIASSFIRSGMFDRMILLYAPLVGGTAGVAWYGEEALPSWLADGDLAPVHINNLDGDIVIIYDRRRTREYLELVTEAVT